MALTNALFGCYTDPRGIAPLHNRIQIGRWDRERPRRRGAEGESKSSQAKGPVPDDTPKRPDGSARPPKVQPPAREGISQVTQRGHKISRAGGLVSFFAAKKEKYPIFYLNKEEKS